MGLAVVAEGRKLAEAKADEVSTDVVIARSLCSDVDKTDVSMSVTEKLATDSNSKFAT